MKITNYNYKRLFAEFKPNSTISRDASAIANTLICKLYIQPGSDLARFLGIKTCFYNYMTLQVCIQKQLNTQNR
ncbi:hypothetical protein RCH20_001977 [Psychrobacter sp. PL15]|nr:hypothetical protein [Psychrobacter sp. PL15]